MSLELAFTATSGHVAQVYLALVGIQVLGVTHAYLYGRDRDSFFNRFIAATIVGTLAAYLVLVYGPVI